MTEKIDLTNCDREPIHIPGSIQPHGAMLVCDPASFSVLFYSENAAQFLGRSGDLSGMPLQDLLGEQATHDVRNAAAKAGASEIAGVLLGLQLPNMQTALDLVVHRHNNRMFVEIEPSIDGGKSAHDALDTTQVLIRRIGLETEVDGIAAAGAKLIRGMLGYDRVMVYRFLHNGAGRVIAEAKRSTLASFLGQHFPASDIPYQARRLYLANTIRMIGDTSYTPAALQPHLADGEAPIDMSFAQLRSVSPIHLEYLRNMGVFASMSISIIVDGELWGLISCHHDSPKVVPMPMRIGAELFGQYFSLQIAVAERRANLLASTVARDRLDKIVRDLSENGPLIGNLRRHLSALAELIEADGFGLWTQGQWNHVGTTPSEAALVDLRQAIIEDAKGVIWQTQDLTRFGGEAVFGPVAGVLAIPLSSTPRDYLLFFRNEEAHNIEWAGEPVKQVVSTPQGDRLTPRGSFETWREEVRGKSRPWSNPELAVAEAIRTYLRDVVLRQNEQTAEERLRAEERRRILNDELNHRVKNIITLVKSIALQTGAHASSVADYSASLEGRLRALAFAHDQSLGGEGTGDLAALIEAEAGLHRYGAFPERVVARGERIKLDDQTFGVLALVVHEMMTNAAKYGALSVPEGRLDLSWAFDVAGDLEIVWVESDGPVVVTPSREGFGTKLIQNTVSHDLGGVAEVVYAPTGVRARLVIPGRHASLDNAPAAVAKPPAEAPAGVLKDLSILVVEDQSLVAMDLEESLARLGALEVRLSPTAADALALLKSFRPNAAVLDFNLGEETSEAVAEHLESVGVPYVFATGYGDSVMIPQRFRHVPVVRKPVNPALLAAQISAAREGAQRPS